MARFAQAVAISLLAICIPVLGAEPTRAIEEALLAAQQTKRGIKLYVHGETIGGAVVRVEPGAFVELRNQEFSRIIVRIDRIDAVAAP